MAKSDDVKVHLSAGCYCGRTDAHTHPQAEYQAAVDGGARSKSGR